MSACPHCGLDAAGDRCGACGAPLTTTGRAAGPSRHDRGARPAPTPIDLPEELVLTDVIEARRGPVSVDRPRGGTPAVERAGKARGAGAAAYLSLQASEQAVLHAASRIYAAWIVAGQVTEANQEELADRAVRTATRMALVTDRYLQADDEDW